MSQCEVLHPVDETRCMHPDGEDHDGKHVHYNGGTWSESYLTIHNNKIRGNHDPDYS